MTWGGEWTGARDMGMGNGSDGGHRRRVVGHVDGTGIDVRLGSGVDERRYPIIVAFVARTFCRGLPGCLVANRKIH